MQMLADNDLVPTIGHLEDKGSNTNINVTSRLEVTKENIDYN